MKDKELFWFAIIGLFILFLPFYLFRGDSNSTDGKIISITENGITCAKVVSWGGQSCWRE